MVSNLAMNQKYHSSIEDVESFATPLTLREVAYLEALPSVFWSVATEA